MIDEMLDGTLQHEYECKVPHVDKAREAELCARLKETLTPEQRIIFDCLLEEIACNAYEEGRYKYKLAAKHFLSLTAELLFLKEQT